MLGLSWNWMQIFKRGIYSLEILILCHPIGWTYTLLLVGALFKCRNGSSSQNGQNKQLILMIPFNVFSNRLVWSHKPGTTCSLLMVGGLVLDYNGTPLRKSGDFLHKINGFIERGSWYRICDRIWENPPNHWLGQNWFFFFQKRHLLSLSNAL